MVSACLAGINCTYKSKNNLNRSIKNMYQSGVCVLICPEVMGGLPAPRPRIEIKGGDGFDVLAKKARAINVKGADVTGECLKGVRAALRLAKKYDIKKAILKSNSPCCGKGHVYDGSFKGVLAKGSGILTAALTMRGIRVITEKEFKD